MEWWGNVKCRRPEKQELGRKINDLMPNSVPSLCDGWDDQETGCRRIQDQGPATSIVRVVRCLDGHHDKHGCYASNSEELQVTEEPRQNQGKTCAKQSKRG